jgi:hypothetical protein
MNMVVALMFLQAPFMHVHEHESTERHPHGFLHTHFSHAHLSASRTPEVRDFDPDEDAHFLDWFTATLGDFQMPLYLPTPVYSFAPTLISAAFSEPAIRSGHDPPHLSRSSPRAPPA